jgi:hypothetical protein
VLIPDVLERRELIREGALGQKRISHWSRISHCCDFSSTAAL